VSEFEFRRLVHRFDTLEIEFRRLRALVLSMRTKDQGTDAKPPPMDFMVDMFDRKDADNLGPYWGDPVATGRSRFAIRTKRAVPFNPGTLARRLTKAFQNYTTSETPARSIIFDTFTTTQDGVGDPINAFGPRLYYTAITSQDIKTKITFDGPRHVTEQGEGANETLIIAPAAPAGIVFSNETNQLAGGAIRAFDSPGTSIPPTAGAMRLMSAEFGDFATVRYGLWSEAVDSGTQFSSMRSSPVASANNVLELSVIKGLFTLTLNGQALYAASPPILANPSQVGLGSYLYNSLADAVARGLPFWGITSFKAWRSDMPEPPNESGHGIYRTDASVKNQFADAYHKPITNTVTGELTGYTYNPEP
jgi:hypothetical protein